MNNIQELIIRVHVPHVAHNAQNVFNNYFTQHAPLLVHCKCDWLYVAHDAPKNNSYYDRQRVPIVFH